MIQGQVLRNLAFFMGCLKKVYTPPELQAYVFIGIFFWAAEFLYKKAVLRARSSADIIVLQLTIRLYILLFYIGFFL